MKKPQIILSFILQLSLLSSLLVTEYPLGLPLLTTTICVIWLARQSWLYQLTMSLCLSLVIALVFTLSWVGGVSVLLGCFWVVQKGHKQRWPQVVIVLLVLLLIVVGIQLFGAELFATSRSRDSLLWHSLFSFVVITSCSKSSRRQLRQIWQARQWRTA